ncbi:hypothetical protein J6TS1_18750 [Siminovitchia terrae]|uniref:Uncharacterized protein n=1 Tax=Siminovitchia terrae TaxID=1914933 RepID=A0ABQ4KVN2_SIMTE|nr:hypothetical protein J6TS1_18750 [Siminovitchia terrae]
MQLGVSSLHADTNPHYGTGKGATVYRFTSDHSLLTTQRLFKQIQGMQFMFRMVYYIMRRI